MDSPVLLHLQEMNEADSTGEKKIRTGGQGKSS